MLRPRSVNGKTMTNQNSIETDRLYLRPPAPEDFNAWASFMADTEVQEFLGGVQPRGGAWRSLCLMAGSWSIMGYGMFSVLEKASGQWIGRIGPWQPEGWPGTEVGWGLARSAWGKGYAVEAARASIDWAFTHLGWSEVIHCIDPRNVNSQQVAKRLGSRLLRPGKLPEPFNIELDLWGQSHDEWLADAR